MKTRRCILVLLLWAVVATGEAMEVLELDPSTDLAVALSNAPDNSLIRLTAGRFPVLPSKVLSNGLGAINIFSKSNLTIEGVPGLTIIDGSSAVGEVLYLTNSSHITMRGVTVVGKVVTNYTLLSGIGHVWGSFAMYAVDNVTVENCRFIDGHDHGIHDLGAQAGWNTISTNNILIRSNYFDNFGSGRTNEVITTDGTAIVPTGWTVEENEFQNCLRCVEPFSESDSIPNPFFNCIIRSNRMINTLDSAILTAGSTNGNRLVIEGNYFFNDPGYSRRGSNMVPGIAILLNDGHDHVIRGNRIINAPFNGIAIGGSPHHTTGVLIESNIIENIDAGSQGFGIFAIAAGTAEVRNLVIRNNTISRAKNYAIFLLSTRDALVTGNTIRNPSVAGGPAIKLSTFNNSSNVNIVIVSNIISDTTSKMTHGIEVTTNNHAIRAVENCIEGATIHPIGNQAGAELVYASRGLQCAASPLNVRINEWLADNSGVLFDPADLDPDDCFELHNAESFSVDLSGYFLTDDADDPLKSGIPSLSQSVVPPGGFLTVWADNEPHQNSDTATDLHAGFHLKQTGGTVSLRAADASVIHSVTYAAQIPNVSEGLQPGSASERIHMSPPSPGGTNRSNNDPTIVGAEGTDSIVTITFISKEGTNYQIVSSQSPDASQWTPLGEPVNADTTLTRITNPVTGGTKMFFRVAALP